MLRFFHRTRGHVNVGIKNVSFELDEATHLELKIKCAKMGITIKEYVAELVKKDVKEQKDTY